MAALSRAGVKKWAHFHIPDMFWCTSAPRLHAALNHTLNPEASSMNVMHLVPELPHSPAAAGHLDPVGLGFECGGLGFPMLCLKVLMRMHTKDIIPNPNKNYITD